MQSQLHNAFGEVTSDVGEGARTGYIGRERDVESDLGFYGVRLYEPEYGRFMSTDPLWGMYLTMQPYQYAGNNPVGLFDSGGDRIKAVGEEAQKVVRASVEREYRDYVEFDSQGYIHQNLLQSAMKSVTDVDANIAILTRMDDNPLLVTVSVSDKVEYEGGSITFSQIENAMNQDQDPSNDNLAFLGLTMLPDRTPALGKSSFNVSKDEGAYVYINPSRNEGNQVGKTTAHELFGHVRFFMMKAVGVPVNPYHVYSTSNGVRVDTNRDLDSAIKKAESNAE